MNVVISGGSACPDGLRNLLIENGVNLISHYGTTETGQLMISFTPASDKLWNYVRVHKLQPFTRVAGRRGNLFELVILDGWPSKIATNRDDGAYATKDLFEPHPTIHHAWRFCGRLDNTIMLMNGEKAIPIPMRMALKTREFVKDAAVFGSGISGLGMMIIASDAGAKLTPDKLIENIWPLIVNVNKISLAYAQISRDATVVLPVGTVYPQTDKGTLIR